MAVLGEPPADRAADRSRAHHDVPHGSILAARRLAVVVGDLGPRGAEMREES
ncbi:MAG: hypothetical protein ACR2F6_15105 [Mycobacteriales bacterium]